VTASVWYPLLRRLRAAGWEHERLGGNDTSQHVWRRTVDGVRQELTSDELLSVRIGEVEAAAAGLDPLQVDVILTEFGAFERGGA
jgi:hypothetical protein